MLERQLEGRAFLVEDEYSIADIMVYPWIGAHARLGQDMTQFPALTRWFETVKARPATVRAYALGEEIRGQSHLR